MLSCPAEFTHKESGVHYRIYAEDGKGGGERAWLSFDRPGDPEVRVSANSFITSAQDAAAAATCLKRTGSSSSLP